MTLPATAGDAGEPLNLGHGAIARKVAAIARSVVGPLQHDGQNKFHHYSYSSEPAILAAIRDKQAELQIAIVPSVVPESITVQPVTTERGGTRFLTTLVVGFTVID